MNVPNGVPQISIELDVAVPMRDGTNLRADIYRPAGEGPWPVLLQRTPYGKSSPFQGLVLDAVAAVLRGYIVVQQDTRGRFASDGEWLPWAYERQDGHDSVEWAAQLPGSNGKVGMFGGSYTGHTQWAAAISGPPHLVAIAPQVTWSEPNDGIFFRGGALELGLNAPWSLGQSLGQLWKTGASPDELDVTMATMVGDLDDLANTGYWELPSGDLPAIARTGMPDIGLQRALRDPRTSEECRVAGHYDELAVPSLNIGGWYDIFMQGTLDNYRAMRERGLPTRLVMGPWNHYTVSGLNGGQTGEVNFGVASCVPPGANSASLTEVQLDWFDHWLGGADASKSHQSGVKIFVMGINQWREEDDWPLARAEATRLHLREGGHLTFEAPTDDAASSVYVYDPADPVLTRGGAQVMSSEFPAGPLDQAAVETRKDVLVFTSDVLPEDLEVTGRVSARLFASTDVVSTDWVVRLCDVDERGVSHNIADGILRAATSPGSVDEHEIDLWSTSMVFKAGHRLRVHVTSSNFPRWDRNLNTGAPVTDGTHHLVANQTVYHDASWPSHLVLPVVR
ncbi:X-Pro dipeptidyl-peptidase-like protein [metagenome]|uniref:X-Pro dipeptidyl-peptidase-like protein n=1 Tax=metagenome TaxID=256318 RepID=A0A2P2C3Y8_9ZZZZ